MVNNIGREAIAKLIEENLFHGSLKEQVVETGRVIRDELQNNFLSLEGNIDRSEIAEFHNGAIDSLTRTLRRSVGTSRDEVDLPRLPLPFAEWRRQLDAYTMKFPGELTHYVYGLELVSYMLTKQSDISIEARREWLSGLLDQMTAKEAGDVHNPQVAEKAYAGPTEIEIDQLANTVYWLKKTRPGFDASAPVLLGGVGAGRRVEGPAIERLKQYHVLDPTTPIYGVDKRPPAEHWQGMMLRQGDLENLVTVRNNPDWINKMQLTALIGSVTSNMDLVAEQVRYLLELGAVTKEGGYLYLNLGALEPVSQLNERVQRAAQFAQQFGREDDGSLPINPHWARATDKPGEVGARIQSIAELLAIARLTKWECINLPKRGSQEWRVLMEKAQDPTYLTEATEHARSAFDSPFYAVAKNDLYNARMDLVFERQSTRSGEGELGIENLIRSQLETLFP